MPGIESSFWRGRLQRRRGEEKKLVRSRKVFPGACIPTRAKATLSTMPGIESSLWRGIRFAKEAVVFRLAKRVTVRAPVALAIVACFLRACFLLSYIINNQCLVYWYRLKGNKNQWLEFQGTLGFLFQLADRKGWIQQSSPWSSHCSRFLNSGFTVLQMDDLQWKIRNKNGW